MRPWEREASSDCGGLPVVVLLDMERLVRYVGGGGQGKNAHSLRRRAGRRQRLPTIRTTPIRNVIVRMRDSASG
ncbi:hypothetical protein GCM10022384_26460 [Streptomyces marokkonensis]|uniref:Uncharacterized protein n=1 Tax=Streptomyces marokkonensis TaxID=324855 RepID=A0ABP7Q154_9ACTN